MTAAVKYWNALLAQPAVPGLSVCETPCSRFLLVMGSGLPPGPLTVGTISSSSVLDVTTLWTPAETINARSSTTG